MFLNPILDEQHSHHDTNRVYTQQLIIPVLRRILPPLLLAYSPPLIGIIMISNMISSILQDLGLGHTYLIPFPDS
jgi:Na+-transporting methylmalonyl-CoA/oxaloacetate decarboxylase beta subunit